MKDLITEQWMTDRSFEFEYLQTIPIGKIVVSDEAHEQIRLSKALNTEHVNLYRMAYESGAELPAIMLYHDGESYAVLNGIHRLTAARAAGKENVDGYVVDVSDADQVDEIRRTVNLMNGLPMSSNERIEQALHLVNASAWTAAKAARAFGLTESILSIRQRAADALVRVARVTTGLSAKEIEALIPMNELASSLTIPRDEVVAAVVAAARRLKASGVTPSGDLVGSMFRDGRRMITDSQVTEFAAQLERDYPGSAKRVGSGPLPEERAVIYKARIQKQRFISYVDKNLVRPRLTKTERNAAVRLLTDAIRELGEQVKAINAHQGYQEAYPTARDGRGRSAAGRKGSRARDGAFS